MSKGQYGLISIGIAVVVIVLAAILPLNNGPEHRVSAPKAREVSKPIVVRTDKSSVRATPDVSDIIYKSAPLEALSNSHTNTATEQAAKEFQDARLCHSKLTTVASLQDQVVSCESLSGLDKFREQYNACSQHMAETKAQLSKAQSEIGQCDAGSSSDRSYFEKTKLAAAAGNADAQICYVLSSFGDGRHAVDFSDQDLLEYKDEAIRYASEALARGDWRIVKILSTERFTRSSGMLPYLTDGNPRIVYRMNRLMRLGATGDYAKSLDNLANYDLLSSERVDENKLTDQDVADANAWAQQVYGQYFAGSPSLTKAPMPCALQE